MNQQQRSVKRCPWRRPGGAGRPCSPGAIALLLLGLLSMGSLAPPVCAQTTEGPPTEAEVEAAEDEDRFLNPLEFNEPEPLLPETWPEMPLSGAQQQRLQAEINQLDAAATELWLLEQPEEAFEVWYRMLRLERAMGLIPEVVALGRIGQLAWENDRTPDVGFITDRLETIQADEIEQLRGAQNLKKEAPDPPLPPDLVAALAKSYAQVRFYPGAAQQYETLLAQADAQGNEREQERLLVILSELHREWFRFPAAIAAYERLVVMATAQFDDEALQRYLDDLAYLYDETEQWESAIATKEVLFVAYLKKEELLKLAPLRLSIGQNYEALEDGEQASLFYQEAFDLAWVNQQYAYASDALTALSELYYSYGQLDAAIAILNEQLKATDYADDHYREMTTYDRLGELYLELQQYPEAIAAFSAGLEIARDLGHREAYFEERVQGAIAASF